MKKIFTLAIALIATIGVTCAQDTDRVMLVNMVDGTVNSYDVSNVESVTFGLGWTSLGTCQYTEDYLATIYYMVEDGDMVVTYNVEIEEKDDTPGLYRLVDPYGAAYPYNNYGTKYYDDSWVFYMEINATDPDGVYIKRQETNFMGNYPNGPFDFGQLWVSSNAWESFLSNGIDLDVVKSQGGILGTLKDGIITFPEKQLMAFYPEHSYDRWYANWNTAFKVVLPSARVHKSPEAQSATEKIDFSTTPVKSDAKMVPAEVK